MMCIDAFGGVLGAFPFVQVFHRVERLVGEGKRHRQRLQCYIVTAKNLNWRKRVIRLKGG